MADLQILLDKIFTTCNLDGCSKDESDLGRESCEVISSPTFPVPPPAAVKKLQKTLCKLKKEHYAELQEMWKEKDCIKRELMKNNFLIQKFEEYKTTEHFEMMYPPENVDEMCQLLQELNKIALKDIARLKLKEDEWKEKVLYELTKKEKIEELMELQRGLTCSVTNQEGRLILGCGEALRFLTNEKEDNIADRTLQEQLVDYVNKTIDELKGDYEKARVKIGDLTKEQKTLNSKHRHLTSVIVPQMKEIEKAITQRETLINVREKELSQLENELEAVESLYSDLCKRHEAALQAIGEKESKLETLNQKLSNVKKRRKEVHNEIEEYNTIIDQCMLGTSKSPSSPSASRK